MAAPLGHAAALLAGSCPSRLLLGLLLLAGEARLSTLCGPGYFDRSGGGWRFDNYRFGGADRCAIFFFLFLVCHGYPLRAEETSRRPDTRSQTPPRATCAWPDGRNYAATI